MYCHILRVRAIPTLESADSMIHIKQVLCRILIALPFHHHVGISVSVFKMPIGECPLL